MFLAINLTMAISRRNFFQQCVVSALAGATFPKQTDRSFALQLASPRTSLPTGLIYLDNNENAYGPSEKVTQAMGESLNLVNRYPGQEYERLSETIATLHGIKMEQVVLGCGSSEILRMTATAFLGPAKRLVIASPTFDLIADDARGSGAEVVPVPLTKQYAHNLNAMLTQIQTSEGLVYICNPNNPTASLTPRKDIEGFLNKLPAKVYVVIDEAYHDYVGTSSSYTSFLDRRVDNDRVIVTRTLSAIYGLAGLRIGYAIATPQTARQLSAVRLQFDVNIIAARAAVAALDDTQHLRASTQQNINDRQEFLNQAGGRMVRLIDSHTNFVMLKAAKHGEDVIEHFKKNNILLGPLVPSMPMYVRVTLGTPAEMKEFWRVWDLMPSHGMSM
jgi:histidinol-phosphate aminotransferase